MRWRLVEVCRLIRYRRDDILADMFSSDTRGVYRFRVFVSGEAE